VVSRELAFPEGLRDFLGYYLLAKLEKARMRVGELAEGIREESAGNEKYRPGGGLDLLEPDLVEVLHTLMSRDLVRIHEGDKSFSLTAPGRGVLRRMEREKERSRDSKEEATSRLVSILVSDAEEDLRQKYVLDVGTGEGYLAFRLADAGFRVLGIDSTCFDYSKDSLAKARRKVDGSNPEFRVAEVKDLEGEGIFDYVAASQSIHCMKDQRGCICSIYRLLRQGGLLIASDILFGLKGYYTHGFHSFLALPKERWMDILTGCGYVSVRIHEIEDFCVVEARKPPG
jgi:2-polyprenyl-3-methyl-5-hydroxy-6-metoxy-1,4-benzoquinol methylase